MKGVQTLLFLSAIVFSQATHHNIDDLLDSFREAYEYKEAHYGREFLTRIGFSSVSYEKDYECPPNRVFDFIVAGGGGAGAVVANRLSENPNWKVLLIEAGEEADVLNNIPSLAPIWRNTDINWKSHCNGKQANIGLGMENGVLDWVSGKGLGGSTLTDYMMADRGSPEDYNRWGAQGNEGWSFDDVLPYFKILENCTVVDRNSLRGTSGPICIENHPDVSEAGTTFVKAAVNQGYLHGHRNNGGEGTVSMIERMTRRGLRETTEKSYLRRAKDRANLEIITNSYVYKVISQGTPPRAIGVKYVHRKDNVVCLVKAEKEIILSAGAFGSPQILMHSGIGQHDELQKFHIPCISDLPVGKCLYDHLAFPGLIYRVNKSITYTQDQLFGTEGMDLLVRKGQGPLTSITGFEAWALYKTPLCSKNSPPDTALAFISTGLNCDSNIYKKVLNMDTEVYEGMYEPYFDEEYVFQISPILLLPQSKGHLHLASENPFQGPIIHAHFLDHPHDVKRLMYAIREAQRIAKAPPFNCYGAEQIENKIKACKEHPFDSDAYYLCAIKYVTAIVNDPVATCKMGPDDDEDAVVDARLRVRGVGGLRVVDCSVIPGPLSAIGNLPTLMVAEKGAHMIWKAWQRKG